MPTVIQKKKRVGRKGSLTLSKNTETSKRTYIALFCSRLGITPKDAEILFKKEIEKGNIKKG